VEYAFGHAGENRCHGIRPRLWVRLQELDDAGPIRAELPTEEEVRDVHGPHDHTEIQKFAEDVRKGPEAVGSFGIDDIPPHGSDSLIPFGISGGQEVARLK